MSETKCLNISRGERKYRFRGSGDCYSASDNAVGVIPSDCITFVLCFLLQSTRPAASNFCREVRKWRCEEAGDVCLRIHFLRNHSSNSSFQILIIDIMYSRSYCYGFANITLLKQSICLIHFM